MLNMGICDAKHSCYSCKSNVCFHAGDIGADCPKHNCDMKGIECEDCDFVKNYIRERYGEEVLP